MDEKELATELVKLINMSPEEKIDKLVEMAMRSAITSAHAADEMVKMRATLEALPQKCLGQRLECAGQFSEIRTLVSRQGEDDGEGVAITINKRKLGALIVSVILAFLTLLGTMLAGWLNK